MTIDEMKKRLRENCQKYPDCWGCPLFDGRCDWETTDDHSRVAKAYVTVFPTPHIKDSGERREFDTGAVRDIQEGKGRCDLMPLGVIGEMVNKHYDDFSGEVLFAITDFQRNGCLAHLSRALKCFLSLELSPFASLPDMFLEVSKHFEEGAEKYGEWNWQKGIPAKCYIDSAVRHYLKWLRGDNDEPHDRAFVWNILCCIWTCQNKPELNDYRKDIES